VVEDLGVFPLRLIVLRRRHHPILLSAFGLRGFGRRGKGGLKELVVARVKANTAAPDLATETA